MGRAPLLVQIIALVVIFFIAVPLHILLSLVHTAVYLLRMILSPKRFASIKYETLDHHNSYRENKLFDFTVKFFKLWHLMAIELNETIRARKDYFDYQQEGNNNHAGTYSNG